MASVRPPFLGAAYYPEDWPLEQIDEDVALMKEAGLNAARIAEFAWSRMEPREGDYDFDWLHLAVDKLGAAGIGVIMCTPTCTPPAWLCERYGEILFVSPDGEKVGHGARRHTCPNSPVYRAHCERIVTRLAREFGKDDRVIGWQIDNEVYPWQGKRACVCPVCVRGFQDAMRERFGTIDQLNAAWGTDLWSQTYQSFSQLPIPDRQWHHPSLLVAWSEFTSDSYVGFVRFQAGILHRCVEQPVGTDMMPTPGVDHGDTHRALDVVQFNHYNTADNLWESAFWFDLCRPFKPRPFWNTETSTCWNGATFARGYREPGFCRANSWLPIALGAEANLYWLWRQHSSGQELMHGAVVSSCGRAMHIMSEVQEISKGYGAAAGFLNDTQPTDTALALHYSHRAAWLFRDQPIVEGFNYQRALLDRFYRPLIRAQFRPDVILPQRDLAEYGLILSPFLPALDEAGLRERIRAWIEAGGTWIVGPFSDIRTTHGTKFTHAPYGSLEEWAGVRCVYEIPGDPRDFGLSWVFEAETTGSIWYDALEPVDAEVLATYTEGPCAGLAAATRRRMGKGAVILLGTVPEPRHVVELVRMVAGDSGVAPVADASENLVVVPREGTDGKGLVIVEIENRPAHLALPARMTDLLTGKQHTGETEVAPYSVMVLKEM